MRTPQKGFSTVATLLVLLNVVLLGVLGYMVYQRLQPADTVENQITAGQASKKTSATTTNAEGTTDSIDKLTTQDINSETSLDTRYSDSDQSDAASTDNAAANIGGAYDESTL